MLSEPSWRSSSKPEPPAASSASVYRVTVSEVSARPTKYSRARGASALRKQQLLAVRGWSQTAKWSSSVSCSASRRLSRRSGEGVASSFRLTSRDSSPPVVLPSRVLVYSPP